jgi:hypothetical protein
MASTEQTINPGVAADAPTFTGISVTGAPPPSIAAGGVTFNRAHQTAFFDQQPYAPGHTYAVRVAFAAPAAGFAGTVRVRIAAVQSGTGASFDRTVDPSQGDLVGTFVATGNETVGIVQGLTDAAGNVGFVVTGFSSQD